MAATTEFFRDIRHLRAVGYPMESVRAYWSDIAGPEFFYLQDFTDTFAVSGSKEFCLEYLYDLLDSQFEHRIPESAAAYLDYKSWARDCLLSDFTLVEGETMFHLFRRC